MEDLLFNRSEGKWIGISQILTAKSGYNIFLNCVYAIKKTKQNKSLILHDGTTLSRQRSPTMHAFIVGPTFLLWFFHSFFLNSMHVIYFMLKVSMLFKFFLIGTCKYAFLYHHDFLWQQAGLCYYSHSGQCPQIPSLEWTSET